MLISAVVFAAPSHNVGQNLPERLFFSVQRSDRARTYSQIYSMKPGDAAQVCLTPASDSDYRPAISPDGKTVAFTTHRDNIRAIYLMNPDGTNQRRLTQDGDAGLCAWSPDGKRITFSSNRNGRYCIYVMNADGTNVRRLTDGPSEDYSVWSPDGRRIAYEARQNGVWRIVVVNADGTGTRPITTEKWDSRWPQWSPDEKLIAYTSYEQGNGDIYVMHPDGTRATRLTDNPADDRQPTWIAGGLLFHSNRAGHFNIFAVSLNARDERRLTSETSDTAEVAGTPPPPGLSRTRKSGKF
jgi:tol-pal system beta propeller repeat protein TolB